ncbi:MAG: BlaI/MecI/CopY family transcriptional regulator [Lachnospiraceae bacterium]|nr:BlaI/MecI/CopY family transcriptional regulator [Lachnospiraceae bacterium]
MPEAKLGPIESRFADIIWNHEPIPSGELAKLSGKELGWKRTTTYTILKRLCERDLFQNQGGIVTSLISREDFYAMQSEKFVEETFHGSLPAFFAAFSRRKTLSDAEMEELQQLIQSMRR